MYQNIQPPFIRVVVDTPDLFTEAGHLNQNIVKIDKIWKRDYKWGVSLRLISQK